MKSWMKWKTSKAVFFIILGLVFISHFPFLTSDPDRNMAVGRGPFTDEGLNTVQVRNWVNHGNLDLAECDNLLKTPFFGFPLALTYKIFGISLAVSRLHVMILLFLALLLIGLYEKNRWIIIIFSMITLTQYQVFHSSHFSMAEMLSVAAILLSVHYHSRSFDTDLQIHLRDRQAILAGVFLSLSYFIKIQFIYLIILLPIVLFILWLITNSFTRKFIIRQGFIITSILLFFLLLYLFSWYLPNREAYDYMMAHQSGTFNITGKTWEYIRFNFSYHFLKGWMQWIFYFFFFMAVMGFILLIKTKSLRYKILFFSSFTWFLMEMHKMTMVYLPTRYQVSLLASMGLLMSIVSYEIIRRPVAKYRIPARIAAITILFSIFSVNVFHYFDSLRQRTYVIRDTNKYMAVNLNPGDRVLGAWAPSLTWDSKARAIPVWNHFLNYQDPIATFRPRAVIAETDEQDSEQAYKSQGIILEELADSIKTTRIGQWDTRIYWISK